MRDILCDCRTSRDHDSNKETPCLQEWEIFLRTLPAYSLQLRGVKVGRDIAQSVFCESRAVEKGSQIDNNVEAKTTVECFDIVL